MKILITGTFCSGKTTLAKHLTNQVPGSIFIEEPIRRLSEVFSIEQLSNVASRHYLLVRQIFEEKLAEKSGKIVICDAGIESNLAHSKLMGFDTSDQLSVIQQLKHNPYDTVFFCEYNDVPIYSDGFRFESNVLREELSVMVIKTLTALNYSFVRLYGNEEVRYQRVLSFINNYMKLHG
jgi:nicotinamide riboside kinase